MLGSLFFNHQVMRREIRGTSGNVRSGSRFGHYISLRKEPTAFIAQKAAGSLELGGT
jgi:hypothetical protein